MQVSIQLGALAPRFAEQSPLNRFLTEFEMDRFQHMSDAISSLKIGSFLTEAEATRAQDRLLKEIKKAIDRNSQKVAA